MEKVLKRFNLENSKQGKFPMHHSVKLSMSQCPSSSDEHDRMSRVPYASVIGSIMYAITCSHPDVLYALSMVSRYQENPRLGHWTIVKNLLKYLRNTKDMLLVYGGEQELVVKVYSDVNFQMDIDDPTSHSGWLFVLNSGSVTWKISKHEMVADSTCESDYIDISKAYKEAT